MTDELRGFWRSLFTGPNVVATVLFLISLGMWWEDQKMFRDQMEARVARLEKDMAQANTDNFDTKLNRALTSSQLSQIQLDITSLRSEVKDVKTEVRKIR
jgi:hypothetical protein